jgi:hypothetical protein
MKVGMIGLAQKDCPAKLIAMMRKGCGGHAVKSGGGK